MDEARKQPIKEISMYMSENPAQAAVLPTPTQLSWTPPYLTPSRPRHTLDGATPNNGNLRDLSRACGSEYALGWKPRFKEWAVICEDHSLADRSRN